MEQFTSTRAALDRFLADNPELEQLSAQLATFNVFRALKIERVEIRHSNALAWLLDPGESHGLGDLFLRRVLSNILLGAGSEAGGLTAAQVELMYFRDVEVRREWRHIDVLVIDCDNHLVVLIENKIGSQEGHNQLVRYRDIVKEEFPSFRPVCVFLTLDGQPSESQRKAGYIPYGHCQVLTVLEGILRQRSAQLPETVRTFMQQYLETLRRLTMQDENITELCRRIYRRHREAIDLIVEYGMTSVFQDTATEIVRRKGDYEILASNSRAVWFIPSSWARFIPENGTGWTHLARPIGICCWITQEPEKARVIFEVTRMEKPEVRLACVQSLREAGFKLTKHAFDRDATWSRFYTYSLPVSDLTDAEEIEEAVDELLAKAEEQFPKAEAALRAVFRKTE